ncbi:MAG: CDP-alcohol phosphatidyltransferase family protein [Deltaproteobacteria bacterium]|nr:CDP-alcohol phosphatidyltransferase family protein [Deltaproteobacteria bacterium]
MSRELEQRLVVALADAPGPRVVGLAARERNLRAARKAGVEAVPVGGLRALPPDTPVLVVPSDVAIEPGIAAALPVGSPAVRAVRCPTAPGAMLVFGPAGALAQGEPAVGGVFVAPGLAWGLATPEDRAEAARGLLRATQKPTDGVVSRHLNRPLSRFVSRHLLRLGLRANHATAMAGLIGLGAAVLCATPGPVAFAFAGLLFHLASAWDGVDGEMARVTFSSSAFGAWLDTAVDNATYLLCLAGVLVGFATEDPGPLAIGVAALAGAGVPLLLGYLLRFVRRHGTGGSMVFIDRTVARAAADDGGAALAVARVAFLGLRRDVFALVFALLALTGTRAVVPAAVLAGVVLAALTFAVKHRALVAAAHALRAEDARRAMREQSGPVSRAA